MHLSEQVFRKKNIFYFLLVCIIVGGVLSYRSISKLEDPEIVVMMAKVVTVYPGASAHEVEMQVTNVLEDEISALADLQSIKSQSQANVSIITVELKMTVPQDEIPQRWEFLRRKVLNATAKLPSGAQTPMVIDDIGDVYGMFYSMTADGFSYQEMAEQADYIKRGLLEVDGVRKVAIYGTQTPTVDIVLSVEKMAQMGVFPVQVISAIQQQNTSVYAGNLKTADEVLRVSVSDKINSIEALKNTKVKGLNKEVFKLSDFASIKQTYKDPLHNTMFLNNEKAIGISVSMESGENIIELGERVDEKLTHLENNMPLGYAFSKVFFQPEIVKSAINNFMKNLILSVLIVVIVLMLTMGLRSGLIIGGGLLLTILATFPILLIADGTLQRISLGAFIVAMGMLVDNSIVVIDGIMVDLQKGRRRKQTFIKSAKRTALPLLGATIIAISAFLPAFLSKDTAGTYVHDLFVVLCISLLISWVLAITQVPLFSAIFLKKNLKKTNKDPFTGVLYRIVRRALTFFMKHKLPTITLTVILLAVSAFSFQYVKQTFFPDFNYSQAYIEYKLPNGTSPEKVNSDLQKITNHLRSFDEVKMVVTSQGMTPARYCLVRPMGDVVDNYGELIVNFEDYETMIRMKPQFESYLHENFPDASTRFRKYNLSVKATHTVEAQFSGPDPALLRQFSAQAKEIMRNCEYADEYTISDNWEPMGKSLSAQYNQVDALRTGTSRSDVSNALLAATDGLPLGFVYEGETPIEIRLKTRNSDGSRIQDLNDVPVWNMLPSLGALNQETVVDLMYGTSSMEEVTKEIVRSIPLSAVTDGVNMKWEEAVVHRVDGKRSIEAQCEPKDGFSPALVRNTIKEDVESIVLPEGYSLQWMGEYELQGTALKNIFGFLPISIMIIILVLVVLFNDFRRPAIVLLCIPMAIIGIVPGLLITGQPFTFIAIIGTLGLIGMLIKNSIVLLDEINKQIKEGHGRYLAIINATISRTRPVVMASFTTILGMMPLFGDPMYSSLAVAVISGLLIGTLITLIFVPILYAVFYRVKITEVDSNYKFIA